VILYPESYPDGNLWWRAFPLNILIAFVVALISYYGFEKPFLQLKDRFATTFNRIQRAN
jgi:peptidoglycan/LPS O-acetylase OafA/YrhL